MVLIGVGLLLSFVFVTYVLYVLWSFKQRLASGETTIITLGLLPLPVPSRYSVAVPQLDTTNTRLLQS